MKQYYTSALGLLRGVGLFFSLLLLVSSAWAQATQVYYTQGSSTSTLDAAKAVNPDGTAGATLATAASNFAQPTDIAFDKLNGYIYVADQYVGTGGILRFTAAGGSRTVIVPATAGATYNGLALDVASNRLFFTQGSASDPNLDALKVVNLGTGVVTTLASGNTAFAQPTDLVLDAANNVLYVADQYTSSGAILRFTTAGTGRTVVVPATANADYNGLALDVTGNRLFFTQASATATLDALKVVNLGSGVVTSLASGASNFTQPTDLAYDAASGLLYVADQYVGTGGILRFTAAGGSRTVIVPATAGATYNGLALALANLAPVVTTSSGTTAFVEGNNVTSTPVAIDGSLTVTDADNTTLASATVSITGNLQSAEDVLAFTNTGSPMGNVTGSYNAATGVLSLTSSGATATLAQWQAALRAVTYTNSSNTPNTSTRTISFVANDGTASSAAATKNVSVTAVNDAPIVSTVTTTTVYTHNIPGPSAPVAADPAVTVTDADNTTLASASVSITGNFQSGTDVLAFTNTGSPMGNVTGSYNAATGVLTLTSSGATATLAQWQAALRAVTFVSTAAVPNTSNRTVSFVVNDGTSSSNTTSVQVSFTLAVAAPVVATPANGSLVSTTTPTYSGTGPASSTITVFVDGTSIGATTAAAGGSWALPQPTALAQGSHTVRATATAGGTTSANSNTNTFTVDSTPPAAPVVTAPANGTTVSSATPAYAGTAEPNSTVTVVVDGASIGTTTASASGNWTLPQPTALAQGSHTVRATATDAAGNTSPSSSTNTFTVDTTAPTVAISSTATSPTSTSPIPVTVTFSEAVSGFVAADVTVGNGTVSGFAGSGTTYTFGVTPTAAGTVTVDVAASVAQDAAGNGNTAAPQFSIQYALPAATVVSVTRTLPQLVATPTVSYTVTFSTAVSGLSASNFSLTTTGLTGASVASVSGSGSTYTVVANTGTGDGTLRLNVANATGLTPAVSNTPYTGGDTYNVVKTFTNPVLTIQGTGGSSSASDVTAFVDVVQVLQASTATAVPNALANSSFETFGPLSNGNYGYNPTGAVWNFASLSGIAQNGSAFGAPTAPSGSAVAFIQSSAGANGAALQSLALSAGSYQVSFQVAQRNCCSAVQDQGLNVLINGAYVGGITPANNGTYTAFTSSPFAVNATTWTGASSTDWFMASNWTNGVPTAFIDAIIPAGRPQYPVLAAGAATSLGLSLEAGGTLSQSGGTLDLKGNFVNNGALVASGGTVSLSGAASQAVGGSSPSRFWNLSVGTAGATLSGPAALQRVLTLTGSLATSGQLFTLESNAAGTALVVNSGGVVNGTATVQRYIDPSLNPGLGYRHYSAPVSNTTVADLVTAGFTPVVNAAYNSSATPSLVTPFPTVYGYDQSRLTLSNNLNAFDKGFFSPAALSDPLAVGRGYTVNIGASQLVDFVGTLNNGTITQSLSRNSGATAADAGWQLLGNPYPAPLDYSLVAAADRANLDAAIYVFESTAQYAGQYRAYVNGVGGNPVLPLGQGFFARVSTGQTSGALTFRNSQRLTAFDATPVRRNASETRPLVQLTLRGATGTASDEAYVYFEAGATAGVDPQYDAVKLPNPSGLNLASIAAGTQLAINGLPPGNTTPLTVPLFVGVPVSGSYTLTATQLLNFTAGAQPWLRDRQLGTLTDLSLTPTYTFTQNATSTAPRFELVFGPQQVLGTASAALAAQVAVFPNPASKAVFVELPAALRTGVKATLVDALGRVVLTQALPAGPTTHTLPLANVASGVYSLRLLTGSGTVVRKLIVE